MKLSRKKLNKYNRKLRMHQSDGDTITTRYGEDFIETTVKTRKGNYLQYGIEFYKDFRSVYSYQLDSNGNIVGKNLI